MTKTTAYWQNDVLMIGWYGSEEEPAAYWENSRLTFDGNDETFVRRYAEKPPADVALQHIKDWQNGW